MKVVLVRNCGKDVSVGTDIFCFPIQDGRAQHEECQRAGSEYNHELHRYDAAFELCSEALAIYQFDDIEEN